MKKIMTLTLIFLLNIGVASEIDNAKQRTTDWLNHMDLAHFQVAWEDSASIFRDEITSERWAVIAAGVQETVGLITERKLIHADFYKGKDAINIKYDSYASIIGKVTESVFLRKEDGTWKVSGYWIK